MTFRTLYVAVLTCHLSARFTVKLKYATFIDYHRRIWLCDSVSLCHTNIRYASLESNEKVLVNIRTMETMIKRLIQFERDLELTSTSHVQTSIYSLFYHKNLFNKSNYIVW